MSGASTVPVVGIYFIQIPSSSLVKIGFSGDISRRFEAIQTASPEALVFVGCIAGTLVAERALHRRFAEDRVRGEWFAPTAAMLAIATSEPAMACQVADASGRPVTKRALRAIATAGDAPPRFIGEALKAHRTKHGLTQAQLALRLGCKQGLLAHWEQGKGRPSKYATAIGREFGWTMEQLDDAMRDAPAEDDVEVPPVGDLETRAG